MRKYKNIKKELRTKISSIRNQFYKFRLKNSSSNLISVKHRQSIVHKKLNQIENKAVFTLLIYFIKKAMIDSGWKAILFLTQEQFNKVFIFFDKKMTLTWHCWGVSGRESTGSAKDVDRAKLVRERQNEERQRKLEELRQQALAAQRFREQREEERRRRIDELRSRDNDRWLLNYWSFSVMFHLLFFFSWNIFAIKN